MKRNVYTIALSAFIGAAIGWYYWAEVGCTSGGCMITSHPVRSTIYGAVMGGTLGSLFNDLMDRIRAKRSPANKPQ